MGTKYIIDGDSLTSIADAIREKRSTSEPILTENMAEEILRIESGAQPVLEELNVTENGTYIPPQNVDGFNQVNVNVGTGEENEFLKSVDMKYLWYYATSGRSEAQNIALLNRLRQNSVVSLERSFCGCQNFTNSNAFFQAIQTFLNNVDETNLLNTSHAFDTFTNQNTASAVLDLDLTNFKLGATSDYIFAAVGNQSGKMNIKISDNTLSRVRDISYGFYNGKPSVALDLEDSRIYLPEITNAQRLFYNFVGKIKNNGVETTRITVDFGTKERNMTLNNLFYSTRNSKIEYVDFIGMRAENANSMFEQAYQLKGITGVNLSRLTAGLFGAFFSASSGASYRYNNLGEFTFEQGATLGTGNSVNFDIKNIWYGTASDIRDGQTIGYWFEKFANSLGNKAATGTQTITINTTLYNSLSEAQKALITSKGYTLAHAA